MDKLTIFDHESFGSIRTLLRDGDPWAVAKDVAEALGYADTDQAIRQHCKKAKNLNDYYPVTGLTPPKIIPEGDLYRLIFRSKLPQAEDFRDWVCEEVLPSIRKTGAYAIAGRRQRLLVELAALGERLGIVGDGSIYQVDDDQAARSN